MSASTYEDLFPRPPGLGAFSGNLNFETRIAGKATPAYDHYILSTTDRRHYAVRAIETQAPTTGNPRQYCGINETMWRLDNGAETSDTTFNDVVQGSVICDNGSGAKILIVGFGSSTNPRIAYRDLTTDTTPWTTQTSSTYAQFWLVEKAGADIYAVTDAGVAILGEYRISKCPSGNDPTLAASWGNGLEVGTPEWGITGLAAIGDSIVVGKPDGLYYYNDQTKRFENVLPFLIDAPHAVNGKGMRAVPNGIVYPTHDGRLFFFDGVAVQDVSPDKGQKSKDAGYARITAVAPIGDEVYAIRETWQNTTQGLGLQVITYLAGTATDITADVTDGSLATGGSVATFGNAANDRIYIGSDVPLEAICVRCTTAVNAASVAFDKPLYSNGTTGSTLPFTSSFTAFTAIRDGSILKSSGVSLVNTGFPPAASNAVISWTDINSFDLSTVTELEFGGGIGTITGKYWYALKATASGTGMTSGTLIDEIEVVPSRAGLPITDANDFTHRWRAGGLTEVLVAKIKGVSQWEWHSVYHIDTGGGVWAAGWTAGRPGQASGAQNMGQQLVLWGRYTRAMISEGPLRDVTRTVAPQIVQYGTTKPGPLLDLAPGGTWLTGGNAANQYALKQVDGFVFMGEDIQQSDVTRIHVQMDQTDVIKSVEVRGAPWYVDTANMGLQGTKMQAWLEYAQNANGTRYAPVITLIRVLFHNVAGAPEDYIPLLPDTPTPEVV